MLTKIRRTVRAAIRRYVVGLIVEDCKNNGLTRQMNEQKLSFKVSVDTQNASKSLRSLEHTAQALKGKQHLL